MLLFAAYEVETYKFLSKAMMYLPFRRIWCLDLLVILYNCSMVLNG